MAVYSPEEERRLRLHLPEFETATKQAGHEWDTIDITTAFEEWMARHEYRDAYFASPKLIQPELRGFFDQLVDRVKDEFSEKTAPTERRRPRRRREPLRARPPGQGLGARSSGSRA